MKRRYLIRLFVILCLLLVAFSLYNRIRQGKTDSVVLEYGESGKFTKDEIQSAMDSVLEQFKSFKGCYLKKLWYDEEVSNREFGSDSVDKMVLLSDFYVGKWGGSGSLTPNSEWSNWKWLLIYDKEKKKWVVKSWGYA